jgi:hypothetical protein
VFIDNRENDRITLQNSLIAENSVLSGSGADLFFADILDIDTVGTQNNFVSSDSTTNLVDGVNGNIVNNTSPQVGDLQDNGGATQTHAPLSGSQIIDAGNNQLVSDISQTVPGLTVTTDQRGFQRIDGGMVDIGAVEFSNTIFMDQFE